MRRIISVSFLALSLCLTAVAVQVPAHAATKAARQAKPLELADNAPDRHVVVPGDTLWDISGKFLKEPFRWPELWRMNKDEIKNPHLIYPGQVLILDRNAPGGPRLRVGGGSGSGGPSKLEPRIYVQPEAKEIASIPYASIQAFLAQPLVMELSALDASPRIVAAENQRILIGAGDRVYATNLNGPGLTWHIYRQGDALKDPVTDEALGYEAVHVGSARLLKPGEPATMRVTRSEIEIVMGDRLVAEERPAIIAFSPHTPSMDITGHILTIYGGVGAGGRGSVVSMSKGRLDGLEVGHVLAQFRAGQRVEEHFNDRKYIHNTPEERNGLIFIFRVFDRISYGLIMNADEPVLVGDVVHTP